MKKTGPAKATTSARAKGVRRRVRSAPPNPAPEQADVALELPLGAGTAASTAVAPDGAEPGPARPARARMAVAVEAHGIGPHARRYEADDPTQFSYELRYPRDGDEARWRVTADNDTAVVLDSAGAAAGSALSSGKTVITSALDQVHKLPGPLAHDLLVVVGEDANARTRRRLWNVRDTAERTFEWSMTELLGRIGKSDGGKYYHALRETLLRMARLRIEASGGAGREGKRWTKRTVVFGLIDRLEIVEEPGESRVRLTISEDLAQKLAEDFRVLPTDTYWGIQNGPARRLYQVLDLARYAYDARGASQLRMPVHYLRDRIPIDQQKTAHIVRKLDVMHEELVRVGYLAALPTYADTLGDELRRFPAYPGKRAKLVTAVYEIASPAAGAALPPAAAGAGKGTDEVGPPVIALGLLQPATTLAPEKVALLESLGVTPPTRSDLHERVIEVQQLCRDRGNVGLYTALCKALPEEVFRRVVATVRADRPEVPRAAFVRMAKDELRRHGIEIPAPAKDQRLLAELLYNPG